MRIVGGRLKGRRFKPKSDKWPTRPTTDFAKEALFNIIENRIDIATASVLDLFGGTGNITFEFTSRGAPSIQYVDNYKPAVLFVTKTISELGLTGQVAVSRNDVFKFLKQTKTQYDIVFADPPYSHKRLAELPQLVCDSGVIHEHSIIIIEHDQNNDFSKEAMFVEERRYGSARFSFFRMQTTK